MSTGSNVAHKDAGFRAGVAPGSFVDLLVRGADRTTGRAFTDSQIASQVPALGLLICCNLINVFLDEWLQKR